MKKGIIFTVLLTYGATQASPNPALADWARDTTDLAAKLMTATSTGAQFDGSEIAVTDQVTGEIYRAPIIPHDDQAQIGPSFLPSRWSIFDPD